MVYETYLLVGFVLLVVDVVDLDISNIFVEMYTILRTSAYLYT
jgi:hypothetical protein